MKVAAFCGSARKDGNTKLLLETVLAPLEKSGAETELVELAGKAFGEIPGSGVKPMDVAPVVTRRIEVRHRELEQTQVCLGVEGLQQNHPDRYGT